MWMFSRQPRENVGLERTWTVRGSTASARKRSMPGKRNPELRSTAGFRAGERWLALESHIVPEDASWIAECNRKDGRCSQAADGEPRLAACQLGPRYATCEHPPMAIRAPAGHRRLTLYGIAPGQIGDSGSS